MGHDEEGERIMEITIFNDLTTKDQLEALKAEAEKYTGLYVDMEVAEERKYVKDKADFINKLLKKVDRKRIDAAKEFKAKVEAEAASIVEDLKIANLPFTLLIDEHKAARAKILAEEKAIADAKALAEQIECDHEFALLMNDKFDLDQIKIKEEQKAYEEKIKAEAIKEQAEQAERDRIANEQALEAAERKRLADIEKAKQDEIARQKQAKQDAIEAENARLANVEHVRGVNLSILNVLMANNISELDAKKMIKLAAKNQLPNLTINY